MSVSKKSLNKKENPAQKVRGVVRYYLAILRQLDETGFVLNEVDDLLRQLDRATLQADFHLGINQGDTTLLNFDFGGSLQAALEHRDGVRIEANPNADTITQPDKLSAEIIAPYVKLLIEVDDGVDMGSSDVVDELTTYLNDRLDPVVFAARERRPVGLIFDLHHGSGVVEGADGLCRLLPVLAGDAGMGVHGHANSSR